MKEDRDIKQTEHTRNHVLRGLLPGPFGGAVSSATW